MTKVPHWQLVAWKVKRLDKDASQASDPAQLKNTWSILSDLHRVLPRDSEALLGAMWLVEMDLSFRSDVSTGVTSRREHQDKRC